MFSVDIKVLDERLLSTFGGLPKPATSGAVGYDVMACTHYPRDMNGKPDLAARRPILEPMEIAGATQPTYIGLGFAMAGPAGYAALLVPRSGLGAARGLILANTIGVIDIADYRGELIAAVITRGGAGYIIKPGEAIAQMLLVPVPRFSWTLTEELPASERGAGGFGSTGVRR